MKKWIIAGVILAALAGVIYFAVLGQGTGLAVSTGAPAQAPASPPVKASNLVVAEAKVMPVRRAAIGPAAPGTVAEVLVTEGEQVIAGQVLARLDASRQAAAVAVAEAGLSRAQARLDELKAGARPQEIEAARAAVQAAQAQAAKVEQGARTEDIAAAEAALISSQALLAKAQEGVAEDKIAAARADLARLTDGPASEDISGAELAVEQARATLWAVQTERDGLCGNPRTAEFQCDAATAKVAASEKAVALAQNNVARVKASPRTGDLTAAQARLDELLKEPNAHTVASAEAQVQQAQASLDKLKAPARPAEIAAAQAEVRRAQAQLDLVQVGARPELVSAAEADVAAAKATLQQAKAPLAETELRAPFAGIMASVDLRPGEYVTAGAPVLSLADISSWQIETTDLTELGIVRIREGDRVSITFDAISDLELPGTVSRIRALGEKKQGDILYTVTVKPDRLEERLRWNMTASVAIEPK